MDTILQMQSELVKALGMKSRPGALVPIELLSVAIGLAVESSEVLDELNKFTRPWKRTKDSDDTFTLPTDQTNAIREETIDVLFYTLEIFCLLGMTSETIELEYKLKYVKNLARILNKSDRGEREDAVAAARIGRFNEDTQVGYVMKLLVKLGLEITDDIELRLIFEPQIVLYEFAGQKYKLTY